jgi:serine/threonine protein kinase
VQVLRSSPAALVAATGIRHPNVRGVHQVGSESGVHFLVLETLSGETLAERLARASLPAAEVLEVARGVAAGLAALHRAGIVHGNLDPEKVFFVADGPKLVDFGLGRTLRSFVSPTPREGPPAAPDLPPSFGYLSPEELRGEPASARSDVFSFGATLDEMLAGPLEIRGSGARIADGLRRLVARCLDRDPAGRPADGDALLAAVEEVHAEARRIESSARVLSYARRRRRIAGWTIAAGIAVAAVVDAFRSPPETPAPGVTVPSVAPADVANTDLHRAPDPSPERRAGHGSSGAHGADE